MSILLFLLPLSLTVAAKDLPHILSDEYIELINSQQNSWIAGRNYPEDTPLELLPSLFCTKLEGIPKGATLKTYDADFIASLPESFDAREQWKNCSSLKEIRDQGACGSCWAFGAASAITDRWCIHSNSQIHFSAQDVAGCGGSPDDNGCEGGYLFWPWKMWNRKGIVSGGNYNSNQGCKPYELPNCIHGDSPNANCSAKNVITCVEKCREGYEVSYKNDKRFGLLPYSVTGEDHIKAELYQNGPLEVGFKSCKDLYHYKSGVYRHAGDTSDCGGHAVKLLGWGIENGTKYWLLANSWNIYWADLGGFFKFVRGENHLGIEDNVIGGMPKLVA